MNNQNLTRIDAYRSMCKFLESYWRRGGSDEVAMLLGSMQLLRDGRPADAALWADWEAAVNEILHSSKSDDVQLDEPFAR